MVRYEIIHGNYENKFYLNETSGELTLLSPITKIRRKKQSAYDRFSKKMGTKFVKDREDDHKNELSMNNQNGINLGNLTKEMMMEVVKKRRKRANDDPLYTLTARAYDLGKFRKNSSPSTFVKYIEKYRKRNTINRLHIDCRCTASFERNENSNIEWYRYGSADNDVRSAGRTT